MSILTPKTAGFVNLSYCVAQVQLDLDDNSDRLIEKMTQLAIRAYSDMNLFNSVNTEVVYLDIDSSGIVDISFLSDYVDYTKVAIAVNGKWWTLSANPKILLNRTELDADEAALIFKTGSPSIDVNIGYTFADHYVAGTFVSGLFGMGGGFSRSFFRVDLEKMQIQFDTSVPRTQIILEYISTGVNATGATVVPRQCVETIVAYIHWQLIEHRTDISRFDKRDKKEEFLERETMMKNFNLRFKTEDYYSSLYPTYKQTVKI